MVFSFPAFFISEVYFFRILKFLPISTYTLYNIVLARVHKISIFQSYLLIVFQHLLNYHSYWWHVCVYSFAQSCPTLFDPVDYSPPGYSVHGILQARILRWVAMPFSRGSSPPKYQTGSPALQADFFLPLSHGGSPLVACHVFKFVYMVCLAGEKPRPGGGSPGEESRVKQWTGLEYRSLPSGSPAPELNHLLIPDPRDLVLQMSSFSIRTG